MSTYSFTLVPLITLITKYNKMTKKYLISSIYVTFRTSYHRLKFFSCSDSEIVFPLQYVISICWSIIPLFDMQNLENYNNVFKQNKSNKILNKYVFLIFFNWINESNSLTLLLACVWKFSFVQYRFNLNNHISKLF